MRDDARLDARLDAGVAAGIITATQRDALVALAIEPPRVERGAVAVAYWVGATLVVAALGWFLADRWETLGPAGVLAVAIGYASIFGVTTRTLAREGHPVAAGVALSLVVATAPLIAWALLRLTDEWPTDYSSTPLRWYEPYVGTRRLVVELSTVLASLVALGWVPADRVRRTAIAVPLAIATGVALAETADLVVRAISGDASPYLGGWSTAMAGTLLFGIAYVTDRRQAPAGDSRREDFAAWLYAASCIAFEVGLVEAFDHVGRWRHLLPLLAVAVLAASVRLRRRTLLVAGMVNVVWYVGYLAFDLFRDVLGFPFLLATFGATVLLVAVLVQRRFPALVRSAPPGERRPLPGGIATAWAPAAVTAVLLLVAVPAAHRRVEATDRMNREARQRAHIERRRAPATRAKPAR